nr:DUF3617 domain-containing protein [Bdellovibrio sp. CKG001]
MKHLLLTAALLTAASSAQAFDIKPGLWEAKMTLTLDGKVFDPMAEMNKALAQVPAEQRKQMEEMMAKSGSHMPITKDGYRICYTADMLNNPKSVMDATKSCTTKVTTQTAKKISGTFDCPKEDAKGTFEWTAKSDTQYEGVMTGKNSKGKDTVIRYEGKFVSTDCGKVKPVK